MQTKTDEEVEAAYRVARKLANVLVKRMFSSHDHFTDYDDYVQEGMLAWLQGKDMYRAMTHAFSNAAKLSRYSFNVKKMAEPYTVPLTDDVADEIFDSPDDDLSTRIDANKILKRIMQIPNEQAQFAVLGYLYFGLSLRDLAEIFEKSHEWVRTYLLEPEITKLREEFA